MQTLRLRILGLSCASCVNRVEQALREHPGVASAQLNLATEIATIAVSQGVLTSPELQAVVESAGYSAEPALSKASEQDAADRVDAAKEWRQLWILYGAMVLTAPLIAPMLLMPFGIVDR